MFSKKKKRKISGISLIIYRSFNFSFLEVVFTLLPIHILLLIKPLIRLTGLCIIPIKKIVILALILPTIIFF